MIMVDYNTILRGWLEDSALRRRSGIVDSDRRRCAKLASSRSGYCLEQSQYRLAWGVVLLAGRQRQTGRCRCLHFLTGGGYAKPDPLAIAHESLHGIWWLAEILPRTHWDKATNQTSWIIPRPKWRTIPPGSLIHQSVVDRQQLMVGYAPPNLPASPSIEP